MNNEMGGTVHEIMNNEMGGTVHEIMNNEMGGTVHEILLFNLSSIDFQKSHTQNYHPSPLRTGMMEWSQKLCLSSGNLYWKGCSH